MLRALIVDDDSDMRLLVRMTIELSNQGLSVSGEAASGPAAIEAVGQDRPGAIILDNVMPGMSGLDAARHILEEYPDQRIVLFSASLDDETAAAAEALGIRACLDKTDIERLPDTLRRLAADA